MYVFPTPTSSAVVLTTANMSWNHVTFLTTVMAHTPYLTAQRRKKDSRLLVDGRKRDVGVCSTDADDDEDKSEKNMNMNTTG